MLDKCDSLAREVRNRLLSRFIRADIQVIFDGEQNEYFISTGDSELYHSQEYELTVLDIKLDLWERGVFNFYFVLDRRAREFGKISGEMTLSTNEVPYASWKVKSAFQLPAGRNANVNDSSLAA